MKPFSLLSALIISALYVSWMAVTVGELVELGKSGSIQAAWALVMTIAFAPSLLMAWWAVSGANVPKGLIRENKEWWLLWGSVVWVPVAFILFFLGSQFLGVIGLA